MAPSHDPTRWPHTAGLSILLALGALMAEPQSPGIALLASLGSIAGLLLALAQRGEP
jgi:hypothetical protein